MIDHRLLRRRHLVVSERLEAVAAQLEGAGIGPLRALRLRSGDADKGESGGARDDQASHCVLPPICTSKPSGSCTWKLFPVTRIIKPRRFSSASTAGFTLLSVSQFASVYAMWSTPILAPGRLAALRAMMLLSPNRSVHSVLPLSSVTFIPNRPA